MGVKKTILVVDDEKDLVDLLSYNLQRAGYATLTAGDGIAALEAAREKKPDLVLLDVMMPRLDGMEVTRRLKGTPQTSAIPVVILTAKGEETDIVVGLTLGADDYVTKPFSVKVLLARVASVLRRNEPAASTGMPDEATSPNTLTAGPLTIDPNRHEVSVNGEVIKLTLTEFKLLAALVGAKGRVLTRNKLMDKAMGEGITVTDRAIDVHVTAIRKKLGDANWLVHTVRGVGYRLQEEPGLED